MITIRLKKKPSFYEDLIFSHWLVQDRVLAVTIDHKNRVEELRADRLHKTFLEQALKARHYI